VSYILVNPTRAFGSRIGVLVFLLLMAGFVIWSHRSNIARLLRGEERRVGHADQKL